MSANRIDRKFADLRARGRKAFIAYVTAGDPDLDTTVELVLALEKAGADIIELGVPFSDPLADGPVIQAASWRALQKGTTLTAIMDAVARVRQRSQVPLALMSYYNPVFHFGEAAFVAQARSAGVDGVIIPDLPVEEAGQLRALAQKAELATVFFLAPTTSAARVRAVANAASGFLYVVSVAGVTGERKDDGLNVSRQELLAAKIRSARAVTATPVCIGFGVSTPEQVRAMAGISDGVIVGSAIVRHIEEHAGRPDLVASTAAFVAQLSQPLK